MNPQTATERGSMWPLLLLHLTAAAVCFACFTILPIGGCLVLMATTNDAGGPMFFPIFIIGVVLFAGMITALLEAAALLSSLLRRHFRIPIWLPPLCVFLLATTSWGMLFGVSQMTISAGIGGLVAVVFILYWTAISKVWFFPRLLFRLFRIENPQFALNTSMNPPEKPTRKPFLLILLLVVPLILGAIWLLRLPMLLAFSAAQADSLAKAGMWEDDPKNWYRAFHEEPPAGISVLHSKYWRSNHFTYEFAYFFEVQATPEWKETFLKQRNLELVPPDQARDFRGHHHSDLTPAWFVPDPAGDYEVWDKVGYFGSVWINKTNGHMFFYAVQL